MTEQMVMKLHRKQFEVWQDTSRYRTLIAGRRFGKTTLAVFELFENALKYPNTLSYLVSCTYRQTKNIAWRMLKNMVPREVVEKINESELAIEFINGSRIELKGADNEDSLRGVGVHFIVIDEVGVIPDAHSVWGEVLRPMLADTKGRALFIGTPKGQNFLYDVYLKGIRGEDGYKSWKFTTLDNPYIDPKEVEAAKKELPPTMYDQEFECSFITDEDNVLITSKILDELNGNQNWRDLGKHVIACDPSEGGDECVIYYLNNGRVDREIILHEKDTMKIAGRLSVLVNELQVYDVIIDAIGTGKGVADRLAEVNANINVIYFKSSESAFQSDRFYNRKAEAWWYAMEKIRDKEVPYPEDNEMRRQLSSVNYKVVDSNGKIQLEPKTKTKEKLGRSPDRADAFIMGIYALGNYELKTQKRIEGEFVDRVGQGERWEGVQTDMIYEGNMIA